MRAPIRIVLALGFCASAYVAAPFVVFGQPAQLPSVPHYVPQKLRDSLELVRAGLESRVDAYRSRKSAYDAKCSLIRADDAVTINLCKAEYAAVIPEATALQQDRAGFRAFINRLDSLNAAASKIAKLDPAAPTEPPSPVIDEESQFYANPIEWYDRAALRVRHAVYLNKKWTGEALKAINSLTPLPPTAALTRLSALSAGDVLLVAPVNVQHSAAEYVKGELISLGDYGVRAITAFANGGLASATSVQRSDISHSLTFIREVNGHMLFLDHDTKGTRVIDDRQFLKEYGMREMMVARPQEIVDGRQLWEAAHDLGTKERGYGVTGDKVVCSQMCAIAVARATKTDYTAGNLGPIDVTPGDFYDKTGNVGKHFVVTRLKITPVDKTK